MQAYSSDPAFQTALMGTLVVASVTLGVTWRLTRQRRSILDVLDQDPDFRWVAPHTIALGAIHTMSLMSWCVRVLVVVQLLSRVLALTLVRWTMGEAEPLHAAVCGISCICIERVAGRVHVRTRGVGAQTYGVHRATDESRGKRKRLVVFAPSNNAWIKAQRQEIFEYPPRLWRKFILGHVAETTLEQHALESIGQIDSLTGNPISLDCIRDIFSDGSVSVRAPVRVDNGLVYKIDRVLSISEAALGARSRAAAMYAVPELASTGA